MSLLQQRAAVRSLEKRDDHDDGSFPDDGVNNNWYFSNEAAAIKYGVLFGILFLAALVIIGMWFHANERIKKGLPPLKYHRWLLPRSKRAQWEPNLRQPEDNFTFYQHNQYNQQHPGAYGMHAVPPPAYNPNYVQPPVYSGIPTPPHNVKVDPFQDPPQHYANGESSSGPTIPPPAAAPPHYA